MVSLQLTGRAWKFGDEVDTGQMIPGQYVPIYDPNELVKHIFEDIFPAFAKNVQPGDILVAGRNFGCGSSREHAPKAIKHSGVSAVVAESFARIFYRNAINLGLYAITIPDISKKIDQNDIVTIDIEKNILHNESKHTSFQFMPFQGIVLDIINAGNIINYTFEKMKNDRI